MVLADLKKSPSHLVNELVKTFFYPIWYQPTADKVVDRYQRLRKALDICQQLLKAGETDQS